MKIKKDIHGLYVRAQGWIGRPPVDGSIFQEGDDVRCTHPAGSFIYVRWGKQADYVCEGWTTDTTYWWHYIEGRGKYAKSLREFDRRAGLEATWNRRTERMLQDVRAAGLSESDY